MFSSRRKGKSSEPPLIRSIRESTIGHRYRIAGTHYPVPLLHADSTASGTTLLGLEEMIVLGVMPTYANTHSEASWTAQQTTRFREDARAWIKSSVGAGEGTSLIFCGSGTTAAIDKLIVMLGLRLPSRLDKRYSFSPQIPASERPVVFIGPYEHHSNELPWRASICDIVTIPEVPEGYIDAAYLEAELKRYADRPLKIGSFSAASNVTGIFSDMAAITAVLKAHGAYACWDCAAAAPHLPVKLGDADALFISPHKLPGGAGTPGVLVVRDSFVRRDDLANEHPAVPGGGTVVFTGLHFADYIDSLEHREEGGTPAILESIRAGLAFRLRDAVGLDVIVSREAAFLQRALAAWRKVPQIGILRDTGADRVSTISFTVGYLPKSSMLVHHNFVVALLNDLFGIQARSGCSCAGPYGHRIFQVNREQSENIRAPVLEGWESIKPGWVRVSLNYLHTDEEVDYIIEAVRLVATLGHHMLPDYRFNPETGGWTSMASPRRPVGLDELWARFGAGQKLQTGARLKTKLAQNIMRRPLSSYLAKGARVLQGAAQRRPKPHYARGKVPGVSKSFNEMRWFPIPVRSLPPPPPVWISTVPIAPSTVTGKGKWKAKAASVSVSVQTAPSLAAPSLGHGSFSMSSLSLSETPYAAMVTRTTMRSPLHNSPTLSLLELTEHRTPDLAGSSEVTLSTSLPTTPPLSPTIELDEHQLDDIIVTPQGTPKDEGSPFNTNPNHPNTITNTTITNPNAKTKTAAPFVPLVVNTPIVYSTPKPKEKEPEPLRFVPLVLNTPIVHSA